MLDTFAHRLESKIQLAWKVLRTPPAQSLPQTFAILETLMESSHPFPRFCFSRLWTVFHSRLSSSLGAAGLPKKFLENPSSYELMAWPHYYHQRGHHEYLNILGIVVCLYLSKQCRTIVRLPEIPVRRNTTLTCTRIKV